jgi:hypothetical protein
MFLWPWQCCSAHVLVPLRTDTGKLVGYVGVNPDLQPPFKVPIEFFL